MSRFLFMGVQEDPELDVIESRGDVRIYDGAACCDCGADDCAGDCRQCQECGTPIPKGGEACCAPVRNPPEHGVCSVCGEGGRHVCRPEAP